MKINKGLLLAGVIFAAATVFAGCSWGTVAYVHYINGDKYVAGNREITEKIDTIDIDYVSGDITFLTEDTDTVTIEESARIDLDEDRQVHTWVEGSTLHVRYCASDKRLDLNDLQKKLEITIPEDVTYSEVNINLTSGDLTAGNIKAEKFDLDSTSGNHSIGCAADRITINSTSGDIDLTQFGKSEGISIDATSGSYNLKLEEVKSLILHTTSGDVNVEAESVESFDADSSSGRKTLAFDKVPGTTIINATSGDINLYLPEDADVTAKITTTSGDVRSEIPCTTKGDTYTLGNGYGSMDIDTTSGNVTIEALD